MQPPLSEASSASQTPSETRPTGSWVRRRLPKSGFRGQPWALLACRPPHCTCEGGSLWPPSLSSEHSDSLSPVLCRAGRWLCSSTNFQSCNPRGSGAPWGWGPPTSHLCPSWRLSLIHSFIPR